MLGKFRKALTNPWPLLKMCGLQIAMALLQGVMIGTLLPILRIFLGTEPDVRAAAPWLIINGIALVVFIILNVLSTSTAFVASLGIGAQLRKRIIDHTSKLSPGWFSSGNKTRLARVVTADSAAVGTLAVTFGAQIIQEVFAPAALCAIALFINWQVALPLVISIPILLLMISIDGHRLSYIEEEISAAEGEIAGSAVEFGHAQVVLRAAEKNNRADIHMRELIDTHCRVFQKGLNTSVPSRLACMVIPICAFVIALVIGVSQMLGGVLPPTDAIVLFIIAIRCVQPLGAVVEKSSVLEAMSNQLGRVQEILDVPTLPESSNPITVMENAGIEFRDVSFSYIGDSAPVLQNVSFTCPAGSTTALIGASGAGKTTVTKLIARFFDVYGGSICIGGVDVREYDHTSLLKNIAIIFQDVYLFDGTIEENLRLARPDATKGQLEAAARSARLDEVIARLPDGWQARVGQSGGMLSGGERQRVSIARAILKDAPIVLIDEAVSALDPQNERAICEAIAELVQSPTRTVIIIAHHPATLAVADRVIALENGQITESGSPDELRDAGGFFARLCTQYESARSWHIQKQA